MWINFIKQGRGGKQKKNQLKLLKGKRRGESKYFDSFLRPERLEFGYGFQVCCERIGLIPTDAFCVNFFTKHLSSSPVELRGWWWGKTEGSIRHPDTVIGLASGLDFKKGTRKSLMEGTHIRFTALWDFFAFHLLSWYFLSYSFPSNYSLLEMPSWNKVRHI